MTNSELIFEVSRPGRRGWSPPLLDVPVRALEELLPPDQLRSDPPDLPEASELDVVRHFTRISQLNMCIDTHFYPLGSCTMKYNPKVNEAAVRIPAFNLHPYAPESAAQGTLELLYDLQRFLCEMLGMAAFSLHPAAGAQGEFAGILMARAYHRAKGEKRTKVVLPDTSHGTNPASARLGGFDVVTIRSDERGRTDPRALREAMGPDVALFMLTNPNTLGLFEDYILEIADIVHQAGALLYLDGANLNALAGLVRPGDLGFDIVHVNTHKTLSTPHGGGGPGAGPVGAAAHVAEFLPGWVVRKTEDGYKAEATAQSCGQLRAFLGSTAVLVRAYTYIRALGAAGLRANSRAAILNANYLRARLGGAFPPYVDEPCMHECVLSAKAQKKRGARALDIAKRLLDFGVHPPTTYFPLIVDEALMIEPTETESKDTLDRFADAMLAIDCEIDEQPELLRSAPHHTPVGRLDEVRAARNPVLVWDTAAHKAIAGEDETR